jgi:hypothetical protein
MINYINHPHSPGPKAQNDTNFNPHNFSIVVIVPTITGDKRYNPQPPGPIMVQIAIPQILKNSKIPRPLPQAPQW